MSLLPNYLLNFATCADDSGKSALPTCPINWASQSSQKKKGVKFPSAILMQQAITEGGADKVKQLSQNALKKKKRVRFPSAVLMQQAITVGDASEIKQLISEHGNKVVEEREPSGLPPVMRAVFESQTHCLKVLVEAGADLTARNEGHWTALHVAVAMDDMEAAEFIVRSCHDSLTQVRNVEGEQPIDLSESTEMARFLLNADLRLRIARADEKSEKERRTCVVDHAARQQGVNTAVSRHL